MIVLDSSAALDFLVRANDGDWVEQRLIEDRDVNAPHIIDVEVVAGLRRLVHHHDLTVTRAGEALDHWRGLRLTRYPHLPFVERMWQLRANVKAADAAFVALAEALGAPLITTDRRLASAPGIGARTVTP